jgi:4-nitrophenyl phosphatase
MDKYAKLDNIHHVLIDMDGVLWRGDTPVSGVPEFFDLLNRAGIAYVLLTNNSSRTPASYAKRMAGYGVEVSPEKIINSGLATVAYVAERSPQGTPVYVVGEEGLEQTVRDAGFRLVDDETTPRYVIGSWDRHVTYEKLAQATLHIRAGATFIGTNPDKTWPSERGLLPGAGSILAALEAASGVKPKIIGKPSSEMFRLAMQRIDAQPDTTAMLGDRMDTDIVGADRAGLITILVLTGVTHREDLQGAAVQPDLIFEDIAALTEVWKKRRLTRVDAGRQEG